jgi:hypothetical protein
MITSAISPSDKRSALIYRKGLRVACVVFVAPGDIPPNQRAQLLNGFRSMAQAKSYCAQMGLAWYKLAQG